LSYLVSYLSVHRADVVVVAAADSFILVGAGWRRADELSAQLQAAYSNWAIRDQYDMGNQLVPRIDGLQGSASKSPAILPSLFSGLQWATWGMTGDW